MRVMEDPQDIGKCGCGRRVYCDGSHGLTEAEWQEVLRKEREAAQIDLTSESQVSEANA